MPATDCLHRIRGWILLFLCISCLCVNAREPDDTGLEEENGEAIDLDSLAAMGGDVEEQGVTPGELKYWEAMTLLDNPNEPDYEKGRELLMEAADMDYTTAQNQVGICYLTGRYGFKQSDRRAADWFQLAAEQGDAFAMVNLGRCYISGTGVWKSERKARNWLLKALEETAEFPKSVAPDNYLEVISSAESAEPEALDLYAVREETSSSEKARMDAAAILARLFQEDDEEELAYKYALLGSGFERRSSSGDYGSATQAALALAFGFGVEKDRDKAVEVLEFSKTLVHRTGMRMAQNLNRVKVIDELAMGDLEEAFRDLAKESTSNLEYRIATLFSNEKADEWDPREAIPWFELAAENGRVWAMLQLAFLYADPDSGVYDPGKAFHWFEEAAEDEKHLMGIYNLGLCYYNGFGTEIDREAARETWELGSDRHYGCYAALGGNAPGTIQTYEEELELHEEAARGRDADPQALYLLGRRYWFGYGVGVDARRAFSFFSKALKMGNGDAALFMGFDYQKGFSRRQDIEKAIELYQEGMDMDSRSSTFQLGYVYDNGIGVAKDRDKAIACYRKALEIDPDDSPALNNLAILLEEKLELRDSVSKDDPMVLEMLELMQKASGLDDGTSTYNLARAYFSGRYVEQDYQKAYSLFITAAKGGSANASYYLGKMHDEGIGVEKTYREAAYHFRLAAIGETTAKEFRTHAFNRLVFYYRYGVGFPRDLERALYWSILQCRRLSTVGFKRRGDLLMELGRYEEAREFFKAAAKVDNEFLKGHAYARLGEIYLNGLGVKPNQKKGLRYAEKALELGSSYASYMRAMSFVTVERYEDAARDFAVSAAYSCFEDPGADQCEVSLNGKAFKLGTDTASELPESLYHLGCLFYAGQGVHQDKQKAWELFRLAAKAGCAEAQYNIGIATLKGVPDAPSLEEAVELVQMAVNLGYPKAASLLEKLTNRLQEEREQNQENNDPDGTASSWWQEVA